MHLGPVDGWSTHIWSFKGYWTDSGEYWHEMAVKKHELASAF